ncbi:hypothetical protein G9A89_002863 [Geosiphon pyriformis]|nr:hypothetical protein G9A89_002863 [Geosiphon pyriformis]
MMSDPFFATKKIRTRKSKNTSSSKSKNKINSQYSNSHKKRKHEEADSEEESISSSEDDVGPGRIDEMKLEPSGSEDTSENEITKETPAEKRRRLAKQYIESVREGLDKEGFDAAEIDRDLIGERLRQDVLENSGRLRRNIAEKVKIPINPETIKSGRHDLSVTCIATSDACEFFFTGSKDGSINKWDLNTGRKLNVLPGGRKELKDYDGHTQAVLSLALSSDGRYLVSGGKDKKINSWVEKDNKLTLMHCFKQHKDDVTGLVFQKGTYQLYSASNDRTIKLWNVEQKSYIETLFGHQDHVTAIDALARERCVTVGGRDRTCRLWKIVEESQLVFRGGVKSETEDGKVFREGSLDAIALIDEQQFLSGGDNGVISLWHLSKKKPIFVQNIAHGTQITKSESEGTLSSPYWIISLAALPYTDIFASGSWDGNIRLWKLINEVRSFELLTEIPVIGFVNSLQFVNTKKDGKIYLIAGVGQEHKFGRWQRIKAAKNGFRLIELTIVDLLIRIR